MLSVTRLLTRGAEAVPSLPIGLRADTHELRLPLGWHALIAGLSGSGKSTTIRSLLTSAAPLPDLAMVLIDVKRVESRPWRPRASQVAVTVPDALDTLDRLLDLVTARYELLEAQGVADWSTRFGPRVLLVVDELAGLIATGERSDKRAASLLRQLLERGRAAGLTVVLATQRPSADVVPTSIRDLCALRIAHACSTIEATRMILADAAEAGPAHRLPVDDAHRGQCWALVDGERTPVLARSYWVTIGEAEQTARATAHLRAPLFEPTVVDAPAQRSEPLVGAGLRSPWPAPTPEPPTPAQAPYATVLTADDTDWHDTLDHLLAGRDPIDVPPSTTEANNHAQTVTDLRGQADAVGASARRETPQPTTDLEVVLDALTNGPVSSAELPARTRLPEGRCRRARQALERLDLIRFTSAGWVLR